MTRKEEIQEAAEHYEQVDATNLACDYGWGNRDIQQQCFKAGAEWADKHQKGLWDADKVCKFLYEKIIDITYLNKDNTNEHYDKDEFIEDFRKAMEE